MGCLSTMKRRLRLYAALAFAALLTGFFSLIYPRATRNSSIAVVLAFVFVVGLASAALWIRERKKQKSVLLVADEPILRIHSAVVHEISGGTVELKETDGVEMVVSYFGILLGTTIIKFNRDGIWLKAVEVGDDFIALDYGTRHKTWKARLFRPPMGPEELEAMVKRFEYETGIVPLFVTAPKD